MTTSRHCSRLQRANGIERALNLGSVYLKREDTLPSGFHKYRAANAVCKFAKARGLRQVVAASCGGYGAALIFAAKDTNIDLHLFLPSTAATLIPLLSLAASVDLTGSYEAAVGKAADFARQRGFLDVTPGGVMSGVLRLAVGNSAIEIIDELNEIPGSIFCPVGNGTTLAGMFERLVLAERATIPALYGVGIAANALFQSCRQPFECIDHRLDPLSGEAPLDAVGARTAIQLSGGDFIAVLPRQIEDAQNLLSSAEGIEATLAGSAAVAGMIEVLRRNTQLALACIVCVVSAAGADA